MKESDADIYLRRHLSGNPPREAFKQQILHNSTTEFIRVHRRNSARRRAILVAAAILIAGIAFLGGRLSTSSALPRSMDITPQVAAQREGVTVPSDLVAWLDAARLFGQLGMQDRMARAVEQAGRLLPVDAIAAKSQMEPAFAAEGSDAIYNNFMETMGTLNPQPSTESIKEILAQVLEIEK